MVGGGQAKCLVAKTASKEFSETGLEGIVVSIQYKPSSRTSCLRHPPCCSARQDTENEMSVVMSDKIISTALKDIYTFFQVCLTITTITHVAVILH